MRKRPVQKIKYLYLITTADRYELPVFVSNDLYDVADWLGISVKSIRWYYTPKGMKRINSRDQYAKYHFYKVKEIEENEE